MDILVLAQAKVNPTEDESKVNRALVNMFPSSTVNQRAIDDGATLLTIHGSGLEFLSKLRDLIRQERIRSAARSILIRSSRGGRIRFCVNKQAAFVGKVSFCEAEGESPLGPISIEIESSDPKVVLDYLAPSLNQLMRRQAHRET